MASGKRVNVHMPNASVGTQVIGDHAVVSNAEAVIQRAEATAPMEPARQPAPSPPRASGPEREPAWPKTLLWAAFALSIVVLALGGWALVAGGGAKTTLKFLGLELESSDAGVALLVFGLASFTLTAIAVAKNLGGTRALKADAAP